MTFVKIWSHGKSLIREHMFGERCLVFEADASCYFPELCVVTQTKELRTQECADPHRSRSGATSSGVI